MARMVHCKRHFDEPTRADWLRSAQKASSKRAKKRGPRPVTGPTLADVMPAGLVAQHEQAARTRRTVRTIALATEVADRVIDSCAVILVPRG